MSQTRALLLGTCAAIIAAAPSVRAQVSAQTEVSARRVEVGQPFSVQLTLSTDDDRPAVDSARLAAPPGVRVSGPSMGHQSSVSISGGRMTQRTAVTLTWTVVASKPGTLRLGPPIASISGGTNVTGRPVEVEVVPQGTSPQRRRGGFPFDPFDLFDPFGTGRNPFPPGLLDELEEPEIPRYPEELRVDTAPDPIAFLRADLKPQKVVVGEQVTLRVYAYGSRGPFREGYSTEPQHPDFLAYAVEFQPQLHEVPINDTRWVATKISEVALFPLRAGVLPAGAMKFGFQGRRYSSNSPLGVMRELKPLTVEVVEPPLAGRPPGYKIGDVGDYELSAQVEPRSVTAGDAISVIAKLEGTGNVPAKILIPERKGVDWLDPSVIEKVAPENGVVQGSRTFTYVVRLLEPGNIDLGELTLPFYNPKLRRYEIARAKLGSIEVKPNPKGAASPSLKPEAKDNLSGALKLRPKLGPGVETRQYWTDRIWYWLLLLLAPLSVLAIQASVKLTRHVRERLHTRQKTPDAQVSRALADAKAALAQSDVGAAASALERAVLTSVEAATGIRARALLRSELRSKLDERGVEARIIDEVVQVLDECDNARFTGGGSQATFSDLLKTAEHLTSQLRSKKYKPRATSSEAVEAS